MRSVYILNDAKYILYISDKECESCKLKGVWGTGSIRNFKAVQLNDFS